MKTVILYDKFSDRGHRKFVQKFIEDSFRTDLFNIVLCFGSTTGNTLEDIILLHEIHKVNSFHILTLSDCIMDFNDPNLSKRIRELNISISATLYDNAYLQPFFYFRRLLNPKNIRKFYLLLKNLRNNTIKIIGVPDERINNRLRFPLFRNKIKYIPDAPLVPVTFKDSKARAICKKGLNINPSTPTFLVFGNITKYKGIDTLTNAISLHYKDVFENINSKGICLIIAGKQNEKILTIKPVPQINVLEFNEIVDNAQTDLLFSASDCIIMPYKRNFKYSSGVYSLAAAAGKYVIAPNHGLLSWRVIKYKNGILFNSESSKDLAMAMIIFTNKYPTLKYPIQGSIDYTKTCSIKQYNRALCNIIGLC